MQIIAKGAPKTLYVEYYEYIDGPLTDPTSVTLEVFDPNGDLVDGFPETYPGDVDRLFQGKYQFIWVPDNDALDGVYQAKWSGLIDGDVEEGFESFRVQTSPPSAATLESQYVLNFVTELNPLYVDPEDLQVYFPEVPLSEIAVEIYYASLYVEPYLVDGQPTDLIREYVEAAAACALSRNYDTSGNFGMGGSEESVTLGDLSVKNSSGSSSRGGAAVTRGNAATWCELAMVIRKELGRSKAGMKATQKAVSWPSRHVSRNIDRVPRRYNF